MKKILNFAVIIALFTNCKAQIIDISQDKGTSTATGTYYKDTQNFLDPFPGTYIYSEGTTTFKLILQKKVMANVANGRYKQDLIIGEYQYVKNGQELVNTLSNLTANITNAWKYTIDGNLILTGNEFGCDDCSSTERRLLLGISDSAAHRSGEIYVRKVTVNGQAAIKILVVWQSKGKQDGVEQPRPGLPDGEYTMLIQP